jgi:hypothetical protein
MNRIKKYISIPTLTIFLGVVLIGNIFSYTNNVYSYSAGETILAQSTGAPNPQQPGTGAPNPQQPGTGAPNPQQPGTGAPNPQQPGTGVPNYLDPKIDNICKLVNAVLNVIAEIGAIVGVLFIIWSGFLFIKAQGNVTEIQRAKRTFYTTIVGLAILLGATVITKIIFNTIQNITSEEGRISVCSVSNSSNTTDSPGSSGADF